QREGAQAVEIPEQPEVPDVDRDDGAGAQDIQVREVARAVFHGEGPARSVARKPPLLAGEPRGHTGTHREPALDPQPRTKAVKRPRTAIRPCWFTESVRMTNSVLAPRWVWDSSVPVVSSTSPGRRTSRNSNSCSPCSTRKTSTSIAGSSSAACAGAME